MDERIRVRPGLSDLAPAEAVRNLADAGGHVAFAPGWRELGREVEAWGFEGANLPAAIEEFNRGVGGGGTAIPRRWHRAPLLEPPYAALEVKPSVTFTMGGLKVDSLARVLDAGGRPIPGLHAAGADIGGIYNGGYAGGLALAAVFGMRAAEAAAGVLR